MGESFYITLSKSDLSQLKSSWTKAISDKEGFQRDAITVALLVGLVSIAMAAITAIMWVGVSKADALMVEWPGEFWKDGTPKMYTPPEHELESLLIVIGTSLGVTAAGGLLPLGLFYGESIPEKCFKRLRSDPWQERVIKQLESRQLIHSADLLRWKEDMESHYLLKVLLSLKWKRDSAKLLQFIGEERVKKWAEAGVKFEDPLLQQKWEALQRSLLQPMQGFDERIDQAIDLYRLEPNFLEEADLESERAVLDHTKKVLSEKDFASLSPRDKITFLYGALKFYTEFFADEILPRLCREDFSLLKEGAQDQRSKERLKALENTYLNCQDKNELMRFLEGESVDRLCRECFKAQLKRCDEEFLRERVLPLLTPVQAEKLGIKVAVEELDALEEVMEGGELREEPFVQAIQACSRETLFNSVFPAIAKRMEEAPFKAIKCTFLHEQFKEYLMEKEEREAIDKLKSGGRLFDLTHNERGHLLRGVVKKGREEDLRALLPHFSRKLFALMKREGMIGLADLQSKVEGLQDGL